MDLMRLQDGGYPFTIESIEFMQNAYKNAFENVSAMAGNNVILDGVVINGADVSDGVIIYNKEIIPFVGGVFSANVIIYETIEQVEYNEDADTDGNLDFKEAHVQRFAKCGVGGVVTFPFTNLKRVRSLEKQRVLGELMQFAGISAQIPDGWVLADGRALDKVIYADLYTALGNTYGSAATTFNIPDLRDRVGVGAGVKYNLGTVAGESEHTLTVNELPSHDHDIDLKKGENDASIIGNDLRDPVQAGTNITIQTELTGGDDAHNNMQPFVAINYIIYVGL